MSIHQDTVTLRSGTPLAKAKAAMIMIHGRGSNADDIIGLSGYLPTEGIAYLAPNAAGNTWYPYRFLEPTQRNEPYFSSALDRVDQLVEEILQANIPAEKIVLLGFSQGACLSLEYAARHPRRYGGVIGLSGGLIGDKVNADHYRSLAQKQDHAKNGSAISFSETPIFLGCSDVDMHIPLARVHESSAILKELGAQVTERIYPGMGHQVNDDELGVVQSLTRELLK